MTTRLTNDIRNAFVRSVMDDVPNIDYSAQFKALLESAVQHYAPQEVRTLLADPTSAEYLRRVNLFFRGYEMHGTRVAGIPPQWVESDCYTTELVMHKLPDDKEFPLRTQMQALLEAAKTQSETRNSLYTRLRAVANGSTTTKQLRERLPEFALPKYIPSDPVAAAVSTLPALANLSADFIRAGWPKDKPRKVEEATTTANHTGAGTLTADPTVVAARARKAARKNKQAAAV